MCRYNAEPIWKKGTGVEQIFHHDICVRHFLSVHHDGDELCASPVRSQRPQGAGHHLGRAQLRVRRGQHDLPLRYGQSGRQVRPPDHDDHRRGHHQRVHVRAGLYHLHRDHRGAQGGAGRGPRAQLHIVQRGGLRRGAQEPLQRGHRLLRDALHNRGRLRCHHYHRPDERRLDGRCGG